MRAGTILTLVWLLVFLRGGGGQKGSKMRALASTMFEAGSEGWVVEGADRKQVLALTLEIRWSPLSIEVSEKASTTWYFANSQSLAGDLTAAYGGTLSFRLHSSKQPPPNSPQARARSQRGVADVILESKCGTSLSMSGVVQPGRETSTLYELELSEHGGWIDSRTASPALQLDVLGMLANLETLKIRGSFFPGGAEEATVLKAVTVTGPRASGGRPHPSPCCTPRGFVGICQGSEKANQERFDCRGSFQQSIRVNTVYPRFGRRSGGFSITVTGENFGLSGSKPILRISGADPATCKYSHLEFLAHNAPELDKSKYAASCRDGLLTQGEDKVDCGGTECPPCVMPVLPNSCKNTVLDPGEVDVGKVVQADGVTYDCGGDCGTHGHCCNGVRDQDERGTDCGGTRCHPCNPLAYTSGTTVARGVIAQNVAEVGGCMCSIPPKYVVVNGTEVQVATVPAVTQVVGNQTISTGDKSCFTSQDVLYYNLTDDNCTNVMFLHGSDPVIDNSFYVNKRIYIVDGQGVGQSAVIDSYDYRTKKAVLRGPWKAGNGWSPKTIEEVAYAPTMRSIGSVRVIRGGSGYSNGIWRLPIDWVAQGSDNGGLITNKTAKEGFGTFRTDSAGRIVSAEVWNAGSYPGVTNPLLIYIARILNGWSFQDRANLGLETSFEVSRENIQCQTACEGADDRAVLAVDLMQSPNYLQPPTRGSKYIILGEPGTEGANWNALFAQPPIPEHSKLICEAPRSPLMPHEAKVSKKLGIGVEINDRFSATHASCPASAPESMGFEFGGLTNGWSLHISARQTGAILEMRVVDFKINDRNGDIYLAGRIQGACTEQNQGCLGFEGKHLPNRGFSSAGDFKQLILSPTGLITTWIARLDSAGLPKWATVIDASYRFGVVDNPSIAIDASSGPTRIHLAGLYQVSPGNNLRLWHVNKTLGTPMTYPLITGALISAGVGQCNEASCDSETGVCTKGLVTSDNQDCNEATLGLRYTSICKIEKCMYLNAYESSRTDVPDLFFAEFSDDGQVVSVRERIYIDQGSSGSGAASVAFVPQSLKFTTTDDGVLPGAASDGSNSQGLYLSLLITWTNTSYDPKWRINLGTPARELFLLDDYDQVEGLSLSLPKGFPADMGPQVWALTARFSPSGPIWARLIGPMRREGPFGTFGSIAGHVGHKGDLYAAGTYVAGDAPYFQGCKFGSAPIYKGGIEEGCTTAGSETCAGVGRVSYSFPVCWPTGAPNARWTGESYVEETGVWADVSGNGWHGSVTRGKPKKVGGWSTAPYMWGGAFVQGGSGDGAQFPEEAIPAEFTLCSVTKGGVGGGGAVLDAASTPGWVHGHYHGVIGHVQYGASGPVSSMGQPPEWADLDAWVVVCSQNDAASDAVTNIDGRRIPRSGGLDGGTGNVALGVNDGNVGLTEGYVESWGVWEVVVWDRYLTSHEIDAVVEYYRSLLRYSLEYDITDPSLPPRVPLDRNPHNVNRAQLETWDEATQGNETYQAISNLFVFSMSGAGEVKWTREAVGGNLTATALAVSQTDGAWNASVQGGTKPNVYVTGRALGEWRHADFGVTRWPRECSEESERRGAPVGSRHSLGQGGFADRYTACSGLFVAKGRNTDIFLAKYSGDSGETAWIRRIGQRDSDEVATGITVDPVRREIYIVGFHYTRWATRKYYDPFDMVEAGRGESVGCPMDPIDTEFKERLYGRIGPSGEVLPPVLDNDSTGSPNCSLITHTTAPRNNAAFLIAIDDDDTSVGVISAPWGQCSTAPERLGGPKGCNSDGVMWVKALHGGGQESLSNAAMSAAHGIVYSPLGRTTGSLFAWGIMKGWLKATQTKGLRTPDVDDEGFFNCCLNLLLPNIFDENQDMFEGYIMSLRE